MPPRPPLSVVKLSDHFGQYVLTLKCECGHTRIAQPQTLAALAGWDANSAEDTMSPGTEFGLHAMPLAEREERDPINQMHVLHAD